MKLKFILLLLAAICVVAPDVQAAYMHTFNSGFENSGTVPDGSATGFTDSRTLSGAGGNEIISSLTVSLRISGGYNGDLYGYLSYNGVIVTLVNRVGVSSSGPAGGYSHTGFDIVFNDGATHDIHFYGNHSPSFDGNGRLTGTWQVDGRSINPNSPPADFDGASRANLASFNGISPNGTWTLFLADMSGGDMSSSVLESWGMTIETVPEPVNVALGIFGLGALAVYLRRRFLKSRPTP